MVHNLIFIEDKSLDEEGLKKLEQVGITDKNIVFYRQGATKPELVSVEQNAPQLTNELLLEYLREYLDNVAGKKSESHFDSFECRFKVFNSLAIDGTLDEFMTNFRKFVEDKCDE